ncbi:MAG: adenylate cyclase [Lachnospiraceae bacterium]|nr:adenylate cyclase [Lachnospiraceae bacterium]
MGKEIEKKFLVRSMPDDIEGYPCRLIEQGYLNVDPAIRVRREDGVCYMTYKGAKSKEPGSIGREEYNLPLDEVSYENLLRKADGNIISKVRYLIPLNEDAYDDPYLKEHPGLSDIIKQGGIKIELDVFKGPFEGRVIAEVEFPDEGAAAAYRPAAWFGREVTGDRRYSNAFMSTEAGDKLSE